MINGSPCHNHPRQVRVAWGAIFWALSVWGKGLIWDFKASCQVLRDLTDSEVQFDRHFCDLFIFMSCLSICMCTCALCTCLVPEGGHQIPWNWSPRQSQDPRGCSGTEPRSSAWAANAFNHSANLSKAAFLCKECSVMFPTLLHLRTKWVSHSAV